VPNSAEAQTLIESDSGASQWNDEEARHLRQKITETLLKHNPRLKPFGLNNENANHVELNPPKDDLVIQSTVYWDHVFSASI
jgi:predicted component of type VI protein secretion system